MKNESSLDVLRERYGVRPEDEQVDLCVSVMESGDSDVEIYRVGGRYDIEKRAWVGDAREAVVWRLKESQYEAGYWFGEFLVTDLEAGRMYVGTKDWHKGTGRVDAFEARAAAERTTPDAKP